MRNNAFGPTLAASGTCVLTSGRCDPSAKSRARSRLINFSSVPDAFSVNSSRSAVVLSLRILDKRVPRDAEPTTGEMRRVPLGSSGQRLHSTVGPKVRDEAVVKA